ncbi:MAG TPA: DEAD/DEAH box helicase [Kineosporiaceae bacterium]
MSGPAPTRRPYVPIPSSSTQPAEPAGPEPQPSSAAPAAPEFADLGVQPEIVEALRAVGITHAFPIQAMTLPVALTGHDIIGQAKTGTGKTLGFGLPLLQQVVGPGEPGFDTREAPGSPQGLVVVPTRELAIQVAGDLDAAARRRSVRVLTVYGGRAYEPQIDALRAGVEIVVGTPGRLLDLAQQGHLTLVNARIVVLDEADEMLDLGFLPDVERLLALTPAGRQTMVFSATMPSAVVGLARRYLTQPTHVRAVDPEDTGATVKAVKQFVYRAHALDKTEMVARILQARSRGLTMIFARTKRTVAKIADELEERGFAVAAIHGDLGQGAREQALRAFRNGKVDVLVATDVAARGIDVEDVTHVINYQCPEDEKTYLHRIGRTARAGNTGTAITFVDWDEVHRWGMISQALDLGIPEAVETYSSSPHLFGDLDIPEEVRGILPRTARTRAGLGAEALEDLGETGRGGRRARSAPGSRRRQSSAATETAQPDDGEAEWQPRAERLRRTRQRRRTRGGVPIGQAGDPVEQAGDPIEAADAGQRGGQIPAQLRPAGIGALFLEPGAVLPPSGLTTGQPDDGPGQAAPRRRRRRRGTLSGPGAATDEAAEDGDPEAPAVSARSGA